MLTYPQTPDFPAANCPGRSRRADGAAEPPGYYPASRA